MALSLWPLVLLALLALLLALEGHPAPAAAAAAPAAPDSHKSLSTALGRELAELLGPAGGGERGTTRASGGTKAGWTRDKGKAGSASSRLMRELRTEAKRSRGGGGWGRGGGGEGQQQHQRRLLKGQGKKAAGAAAAAASASAASSGKGCFGLKLDRIGSMSGLGC